jgi:hypothetical protein
VEESTATLLPEAEQVLMELEEEARANWEERAVYQATQVTNLAGEAFETLSENRWSRRDCTEYQEELDWAMRTFQRVCGEPRCAGWPARGLTESTVSISGPQGSWRDFCGRTSGGRQEERRPAGGGYREEQKYRDDFGAGRAADHPRMEYEVSIPMERRPTLPVTEILAAERQEQSWESATAPGRWGHPSVANRGRGLSDLGMAGLNIGAPARLQKGDRVLPPAGASTPLGGGSGELPR